MAAVQRRLVVAVDARDAPPPRLAFVGPWGRMRLLCGPALALGTAQLTGAALGLAVMARAGVALGAPSAPVRGVLQLVLLLVLYPVLSTSRVTRALAAVASGRPGTALPPPATRRLRFELRPLADGAAAARVAELLDSGAFPSAGCAPHALRAMAAAGAVPRGTLLLEVFAQPKAGKAASVSAQQQAGAPSPHRLLALVLARVVPRVAAAPLLGGQMALEGGTVASTTARTTATHPLLPDGEFAAVVLEVPLLGCPGVFVARDVSPRDAAAIAAAAAAHLLARLGVSAAVLPPPAGGACVPFAAAAMASAGAHALPPALGAPADTYVVALPPSARAAGGGLDAFASASLGRSARRDLRSKRRRFAATGGAMSVAPYDEVLRDAALARLVLGADAAAALLANSGAGEEPQLALALAAAVSRDSGGDSAALAPADVLAAAGAVPGALAAALLRAEPRCAWALAARVGSGEVAAAALLLLVRDGAGAGRRLCVAHADTTQPLARHTGASAALLRGAIELALVLGVDAVDLGPGAAGGAKERLGAVAMPRTPLLLFSDDRLAAARPAPGALYGGLLREARDALRDRVPPAVVPGGGKRAARRLLRRRLRAGAAAERARDAARMAAASAAAVDAEAVSAFDAQSVAEAEDDEPSGDHTSAAADDAASAFSSALSA